MSQILRETSNKEFENLKSKVTAFTAFARFCSEKCNSYEDQIKSAYYGKLQKKYFILYHAIVEITKAF